MSNENNENVPQAAAGWYLDPTNSEYYRYFNGSQWTDSLKHKNAIGVNNNKKGRSVLAILGIVLVSIFAVIGLGVVLCYGFIFLSYS
jgi:nitrate reductase NapE component